MKLVNLRICNIASFEEAEVNFESLGSESNGVFLISGVTGAGKSTILDAICLALYDTTPRMRNQGMEGDVRDGKDMLAIKDVRQLLRRTAGKGYVELLFEGNDGLRYRAVWGVARARGKSGGRLQATTWELECIDNDDCWHKKGEIKAKIIEITGLDFKQFCRTTMLAQGEFTKFLQSNDNDKAEILEKVTGAEIYTSIGRKIYAITQEKENDVREITQRSEHIHLLDEDEKSAAKEELERITASVASISSLNKSSNDFIVWKEDGRRLSEKAAVAAAEAAGLQEIASSPEHQQQEVLVKQWKLTAIPRQSLANIRMLDQRILFNKDKRNGFAGKFIGFQSIVNKIRESCDSISEKIIRDENIIRRLAPYRPLIEASSELQFTLKQYSEIVKDIKDSESFIHERSLRFEREILPSFKSKEAECAEMQAALNETEIRLSALADVVEKSGLADLRKERDFIADGCRLIEKAADASENLLKAKNEAELLDKRIKEKDEEIKKLEKDLEDCCERLAVCDNRYKEADTLLSKMKDSVDSWARSVRRKLKTGDNCPVCNQKIKLPIISEEEFEMLIRPVEQSFKEAADSLEKEKERKRILNVEIALKRKALDEDKRKREDDNSIALKEKTLENLLSQISASKVKEISSLPTHISDNSGELYIRTIASLNSSLENLGKKISELELHEKELNMLRKAEASKRKLLDICLKEKAEASEKVSGAAAEISTRKELLSSSIESRKELEHTLLKYNLSSYEPTQSYLETPLDVAKWIEETSEKYDTLSNSIEKDKLNHESISVKLARLDKLLQELGPYFTDTMIPEASEISSLKTDTEEKLVSFSADIKAIEALICSDSHQKEQEEKKIKEWLEDNPAFSYETIELLNLHNDSDIEQIENSLNRFSESITHAKATHEAALKAVDEWRGRNKEEWKDRNEKDEQCLIAEREKELQDLSQRKGAIIERLETDRRNRIEQADLIKDLKKKELIYNRWRILNEAFGCREGKKFRKIAQSFVLENLVAGANRYMESLSPRYRLAVEPGTFVIMLEDAYMGFTRRPGSVASGGESFLISLALALALADMGGNLQVDTLFIDEGFGSLSGEPLRRAINTLERLHNSHGRRVGIISHISELRERIATRILVEQNGAKSTLRIDLAQ